MSQNFTCHTLVRSHFYPFRENFSTEDVIEFGIILIMPLYISCPCLYYNSKSSSDSETSGTHI